MNSFVFAGKKRPFSENQNAAESAAAAEAAASLFAFRPTKIRHVNPQAETVHVSRKRGLDEDGADDSSQQPHKIRRFDAVAHSGPRRRYVSLARQVWEVAREDAKKATNVLTNSLVLRKWEYSLLEGNPMMKSQCEGDRLVKLIGEGLKYLDENGYERSSQQRLFHRAFMQASYKMLYGEDLHKHLIRILEENHVHELRTEVACTTPRRFGKTFSIAMWCAVWLVLATDHDSSIYSTSSRVSMMLLDLIIKMALILQRKFGGQIVSINKKESCFYRTDAGYENSVHAYPAKSDTLRGTGSKKKMGTVVLEEAAYIPAEVSTSIVAPTLTRDNVNLFAISTISSDDVIMKGFMNAKYADGRSVMLCLNFSLVCSECRATGREETCKHLLGELPHWSSAAQHTKLDAMLKNSKETLQREIKGILFFSECHNSCPFFRHCAKPILTTFANSVMKFNGHSVVR